MLDFSANACIISYRRHVGQVPTYYNHKPSGQRSHWHVDYTDMSIKPLYPFGHGLSYTNFHYRNLSLSDKEIAPDGIVKISCDVTNDGDYVGDEVVQLYLQDVIASVTRPVKELKGFQRIQLQPGETATITFEINAQQIAFYDRAMDFVVEPGDVKVMLGSSSEDIRLEGQFTIVGDSHPAEHVFETPTTVTRRS